MQDNSEKENRGLLSRLFGKKDKPAAAHDTPSESLTSDALLEPDVSAEPAEDVSDEAPVTQTQEPPKPKNFFARLTEGLTRSSAKLTQGVSAIFTKRKLDAGMVQELEDLLITADLGVASASAITEKLARERFDKEISDKEVKDFLASEIETILTPHQTPLALGNSKPQIILMIGVNGAGKTTTIGKLAHQLQAKGKSVMLAAGDTFRAAAIEQLTVWGARNNVPVITAAVGADAAGLAYDAVKQAQAQKADVLLIDTAGRLQNRKELMEELAKIVRVIRKLNETGPHHTLLVLDATVGQNALSQAETFKDIAGVTGLVMTKLDGTARGGVLVALAQKFGLPIHFIGVGEQIDDLQPFKAREFARALVGLES